MAKNASTAKSFPFVYLNHGPLDPDAFGKAESIWIAFQAPVSKKERQAIMESCPEAFAGFFRWDDALFYSESEGDVFDSTVARDFGDGEVSTEAAGAFAEAVEAWILDIHERSPVAFFVGPATALEGDPWDAWSYAQVGGVIVPWLEQYLDAHPDLPDEADESAEEEEPAGDRRPIGKNPFTGEPIYATLHRAAPMDRAILAYLGEQVSHVADRLTLSAEERERAEAVAKRLERED